MPFAVIFGRHVRSLGCVGPSADAVQTNDEEHYVIVSAKRSVQFAPGYTGNLWTISEDVPLQPALVRRNVMRFFVCAVPDARLR